MILELGLRYHPTSTEMVPPHNAKIAALVEDLIDIPLGPLEQAVNHWKRTAAYLPKASDLITLARNFANRSTGTVGKRLDQATPANMSIDAKNPDFGFRWIQTERDISLRPVSELELHEGKWRVKTNDRPITLAELNDLRASADKVKDPALRGVLTRIADGFEERMRLGEHTGG